MSDPTDENQEEKTSKTSPTSDSQQAIRRNLQNFLNPGLPSPPTTGQPDPNAAAKLRMAQMELANKMRLNKSSQPKKRSKSVPMQRKPPPGGFGSAHGVFQLGQADFGKKPTASKRSPYQQIFASQTQQEQAPAEKQEQPVGEQAGDEQQVIEVSEESEVKMNQKPKRSRGKKFRNPTL